MVRIALLVCFVTGAACTRKNLDHCAWRDGDAHCEKQGFARPYCSTCEASFDGCVMGPPAPVCVPDEGSASVADASGETVTNASSQESSDGSSTTASVSATDSSASGTSAGTTGPGESSSSTGEPICGDGVKNGGELCDENDLDGKTCEFFNLGGGTLLCTPNCMNWNFMMCDNGAICGNDVVEGPEDCDGTDLAGHDCAEFPEYGGGELACDGCEFSFDGCAPCTPGAQACDSNDECCSESCDALGLGLCL